jgi:hypothetical protein
VTKPAIEKILASHRRVSATCRRDRQIAAPQDRGAASLCRAHLLQEPRDGALHSSWTSSNATSMLEALLSLCSGARQRSWIALIRPRLLEDSEGGQASAY